MDYLDWRGDLPFSVSPFNEVDNYIIAKIGTPDFTGIIPENEKMITIGEAVKQYLALAEKEGRTIGVLASESILPVLRRLPDTERFRNIKLYGYIRRILPENTEQFSALTIVLPNGARYVSFRGTDDTIAGWKENFMMGVDASVPAQRDAAAYLRWTAGCLQPLLQKDALPYDNAVNHYLKKSADLAAQKAFFEFSASEAPPLIVGGHSKGGNLAVYAAASVEESIQDRILAIYNNDGPGFRPAFLQNAGYQRILPKLNTILPQYSIVGTLLSQPENLTIVSSGKSGIAAHDGFNWQVKGTAFVRCAGFSRSSLALRDAMREKIGKMNDEEKRTFVDDLFSALTSTGAVTLGDMTEHRLRQAIEIGKNLLREDSIHRFAGEFLELMLKEYTSSLPPVKSIPKKLLSIRVKRHGSSS